MKLRKYLYDVRLKSLFIKGLNAKEIVEFDDELYDKLSNYYLNGIPIKILIKYLRPQYGKDKYYDRSLLLTFAFENATYVSGSNKDLKLKFGYNNTYHTWVENDGWVYDSSLLMKIKKELYYKMYKPYEVSYYTKDEYINASGYNDIKNIELSDLEGNDLERNRLCTNVSLALEIAKMTDNHEFIDELNEHLELIKYKVKR